MVSSRLHAASRRLLTRKEKIIPKEQLGVEALPAITETMEGVLDWLKSERLHKYWPVFSRMNYQTLVGLTDENMDFALQCIGAEPITNGARGRILRGTERLRERSVDLEGISFETPLSEVAEVFRTIATTPLSRFENEHNGISLLPLFRHKLNEVVGFHGPNIVKNHKLKKALMMYLDRREVPEAEKEYIGRLLENLSMASTSSESPKRSSVKCSPTSTTPSSGLSSASDSSQRLTITGRGRGRTTSVTSPQLNYQSVSPLRPSALRPMYRLPDSSPKAPSQTIIRPVPLVEKLCQAGEKKPTLRGFTNPPAGLQPPGIRPSSTAGLRLPTRPQPPGHHLPHYSSTETTGRRGGCEPLSGRTPQLAHKSWSSVEPSPSHKAPVKRESKDESGFQNPNIDDNYATSSSIGVSIDATVNCNKIWGGTSNQVMFDLNVTSSSRLSRLYCLT